jgi:hypothetical protein
MRETKATERRLVDDALQLWKKADLPEEIPCAFLNGFNGSPTEYAAQSPVRTSHDELSAARGHRVFLATGDYEQILHQRLELGGDLEEDELRRIAAIWLTEGCRHPSRGVAHPI